MCTGQRVLIGLRLFKLCKAERNTVFTGMCGIKELCCEPRIQLLQWLQRGTEQGKGSQCLRLVGSGKGRNGDGFGRFFFFYQQPELYNPCGFILPEVSILAKNTAVI